MPCQCKQVYVGTTKRSINTRIKEHRRNCRLGETEKSAVAEHAVNNDHIILYEDAKVLSKTTNYHSRMYREAIEIYKHSNNFNKKEEGVKLNKIWIPAIKKQVSGSPTCMPTLDTRESASNSINTGVSTRDNSFDYRPPESQHLNSDNNSIGVGERGEGREDVRQHQSPRYHLRSCRDVRRRKEP